MSFRINKDDVERLYQQLENTTANSGDIETMEWIDKYLYASYFMSINPLIGIRKVLPQYNWAFHRAEDYDAARKVTRQSDFVWCTNAFGFNPYPHGNIELVTATLISGRDPRRLFFSGYKDASLGNAETWQIELARNCGGEAHYAIIPN